MRRDTHHETHAVARIGWLRAAILENVEETINDLLEQSPILRHQAESGAVTLVGAYYELSSGRVVFSDVITSPITGTHATHTH